MPPHLFTVGSNPTAVTHALQSVLGGAESGGTVPLWSFDSTVKRCGGMPLALAVAGLLLATRLCDICALEHCLSLWHRPCRDPGSNRGPSDLRSDALPAELSRLMLDGRARNCLRATFCARDLVAPSSESGLLRGFAQMDVGICASQDSLAEWSKALASGASPQGHGFEPHSCQIQRWITAPVARELQTYVCHHQCPQ